MSIGNSSRGPPEPGRMLEGQGWVENNSKSAEVMGICHLEVELWNSSSPAWVENKEKPSRASLGTLRWVLTLAAGSVVAWGALVTVCSLEVGLAHTHPHPGVLPTGVAFGPTRVAVAVWMGTHKRRHHTRPSVEL